MARIAGVNVPENKHVEISLTHIFGIGRKTAQNICSELKIDYTRKISDLSEEEIESLRSAIGSIVVEGDLRRNISTNIKRYKIKYHPSDAPKHKKAEIRNPKIQRCFSSVQICPRPHPSPSL